MPVDCTSFCTVIRRAIFGRRRHPPSRPALDAGDHRADDQGSRRLVSIHGRVVLRKKGFLDLNDSVASVGDDLGELVGRRVFFQLVSTTTATTSPAEEEEEGYSQPSASSVETAEYHGIGAVSKKVHLEHWHSKRNPLLADPGTEFHLNFVVHKGFGKPGALLVTNNHHSEFFLDSVTLEMPDDSQIHFPCNSWVYSSSKYHGPRTFFSNQVYLPDQTPPGLQALREEELKQLRGDGKGQRKEADRIYDYDVYNDLGDPNKGEAYARPTLGGSQAYPYPRRCYTGRKKNSADPSTEEPTLLLELIYVPRDEIFDHIKTADFLASSIKAIAHLLMPAVEDLFKGRKQFSSLQEVNDLYVKGLDLSSVIGREDKHQEETKSSLEVIAELTTNKDTGDSSLLKFPLPLVIEASKDAWSSDEEFARQTLGGMHPITIEKLKVFPPVSKLDPEVYGTPVSSITDAHIEPHLEGMTAQQALEQKKLFILDYHDAFLPYIGKFNALDGHKSYAARSIFFLRKTGVLKPVAIELSLPSSTKGRVDRVFVPPSQGRAADQWQWRLAKTHAILNDTSVHQLISHFLRTHAAIEPIIIASHRQLSAMHPLFVLLLPHFKNTLNINAIARKILLNAYTGNPLHGGFIEHTFTAGRYALELSSVLYRDWRFDEQGLPADLLKRGMAERDAKAKHGLRLVIQDYPYAVDGLEVWDAIESWVGEYVAIYYKRDEDVKNDTELQKWWTEVRERGHGDKKDENWWLPMHGIANLITVLTTIIWLASAHHAANNFGQYPYAGYMPYRPTMGRELIPQPGTPEAAAFLANPEAFLLKSVSSPSQATIGLAIIELLSTHASNEEYLGQRTTRHWTDNPEVLQAFRRFQEKLVLVEQGINARNSNPALKNRYGEVQVPYTLLFPTSGEGITNRGIPNSTSI